MRGMGHEEGDHPGGLLCFSGAAVDASAGCDFEHYLTQILSAI
jgi:hypothetical protein